MTRSVVGLYCPPGLEGSYPSGLEAVAREFVTRLFNPSTLGEVTAQNFREDLPGRPLNLHGLPALQRYREQFGGPILEEARIFVAPPQELPQKLGGKPGTYTIGGILELNMTLQGDAIHPDWRVSGYHSEVVVPVQLRMLEFLDARVVTADDAVDVSVGRYMVFGRTYTPILITDLGEPGDQFGHVGGQVKHYLRYARPQVNEPSWTSTWRIYNRLFSAQFEGDPPRRS